MTSIADRAAAIARWVDRAARTLPAPPFTAADIARTTARLAVLLGIAPEHITPEWPWTRPVLKPPPLTLRVTDPDAQGATYTFVYRDPMYEDEPYLVLGSCPYCHGQVPLAEIRDLADLGTHLARHGQLPDSLPDEFITAPGHHRTCRFGPQK